MSSIQIRNVTKTFGDFHAVRALDLDIGEGEFVALLGPSGCGKTTTMNMIAGIETATEGSILFNGADLSDTRLQDRGIGFVFQNYAIFTHMSVYENLAFGLRVQGIARPEIERRARAMARRMSLEHRLDQPATALSVNELQKLAIGRSAVVEPRVFLLDEPLSNLDAGFRAYMRTELKVLQREFGQTMIYVTHDQIEAMSLADRIAIINKGRLMQYGAPLEIFDDPNSRFVANFMGSPRINMLDGALRDHDGRPCFEKHGGGRFALGDRVAREFAAAGPGTAVSLGIRPQDIYFGARRRDEDVAIPCEVEFVERVGPRVLVHVLFHGTLITVSDARARHAAGDSVTINLDAAKCLAFDLETDLRLGRRAS